MTSEQRILSLLFERSEQALEELERKYGKLCRGIARGILQSDEDADEIVSDTFLALWNQIPPEKPVHLGAYITRVTRNLALTRRSHDTAAIRDIRLNVCMSELEEILPGGQEPEAALEVVWLRDAINRYLADQNKTNRQVFVRRYYLLESCKEIARQTGLTEQAVRLRLLRMRGELRLTLEKEGITP